MTDTKVHLIERIFPDGHAELRYPDGRLLKTSAPGTFFITPPLTEDDDFIDQHIYVTPNEFNLLGDISDTDPVDTGGTSVVAMANEAGLNEQHAQSMPAPSPAEIKAARLARGLDTAQAAAWAEVTRRAWQNYESGKRRLTAGKFMSWLLRTAHLKAAKSNESAPL